MKIQVVFINGSTGVISIDDLDELVEKNIIIGFHRSSGWAMVGIDDVRSKRSQHEGSWKDRKHNRMMLLAS